MFRIWTGGMFVVALVALAAAVTAQDAPRGKLPADEDNLEAGRRVFQERCWFCHGDEGDGNGPVADYLDPRPRDFTLGIFKLRTTESGELPTDEDLFRTISRGIPGTAMPEWQPYLSEDQRWQVIQYIKTFAPEFANPDFDPYKMVIPVTNQQPARKASIEKGKDLFERAKCFECHGMQGRGDGQKSADMTDDWGYPLRIRNLTKGWTLKGGTAPHDIFMRFSTGMNGTPMPSFAKTLSEEERWHLANYVSREVVRQPVFDKIVLEALQLERDLPGDAEDPIWQEAATLDVPLAGQVLASPRWQNHAIDMVTLQAVYNEQDIAILVTWDDPFPDTVHDSDLELPESAAEDTYAMPFSEDLPRAPGNFRDALALQFPTRQPEAAAKPHFFRGQVSRPVHLWHWYADRDAAGEPAVTISEARGFRRPPEDLAEERQQVTGKGVWKEGQWRVVFSRKRQTENARAEIQFDGGVLIPVALEAWDGFNGEHGMLMSISTWHFLLLKESTPPATYLWALFGAAFMVGGQMWLRKKARSGNHASGLENDDTGSNEKGEKT